MKQPKVSIVCQVYKHESYLRECFEGFVMQITTFPFEILVNDDCSPDGSADIMREYEKKYPDLFRCVYQKENQYSKGLLPWFEVLFPMAKGEYIAICEGDDYWTDPYKLQKQVDFMDSHKEYIACFHNARTYNGRSYGLFNSLDEIHTPTTDDIIMRPWFIATASLLYRNVLSDYPEWRKEIINDDYLLELLLASKGKFYYMDDVMAVYRVEGQGVSTMLNANKLNMYDKIIFILQSIKPYFSAEYERVIGGSIQNYKHLKKDYQKELYYESHPFMKYCCPKTYKRMIKKWLKNRLS